MSNTVQPLNLLQPIDALSFINNLVESASTSCDLNNQYQCLIELINLSHDDENEAERNEILKSGGVELGIHLLMHDEPIIRQNAAGLLANLAISDEGKNSIVQKGGIQELVKGINDTNLDVRKEVAGTLFNLAFDRFAQESFLTQSDGPLQLFAALRRKSFQSEHFEVWDGLSHIERMKIIESELDSKRNMVGIIWNITETHLGQKIMSEQHSDGIACLISLLDEDDTILRCNISGALWNLSSFESNRKKMLLLGGTAKLASFLDHHQDELRFHASGALSNLTTEQDNNEYIGDKSSGVILTLLEHINNDRNEGVRINTSSVLVNLSAFQGHAGTLLQAKVVPTLIAALQDKEYKVILNAMIALANLSEWETTVYEEIAQLQGISIILHALRDLPAESTVHHQHHHPQHHRWHQLSIDSAILQIVREIRVQMGKMLMTMVMLKSKLIDDIWIKNSENISMLIYLLDDKLISLRVNATNILLVLPQDPTNYELLHNPSILQFTVHLSRHGDEEQQYVVKFLLSRLLQLIMETDGFLSHQQICNVILILLKSSDEMVKPVLNVMQQKIRSDMFGMLSVLEVNCINTLIDLINHQVMDKTTEFNSHGQSKHHACDYIICQRVISIIKDLVTANDEKFLKSLVESRKLSNLISLLLEQQQSMTDESLQDLLGILDVSTKHANFHPARMENISSILGKLFCLLYNTFPPSFQQSIAIFLNNFSTLEGTAFDSCFHSSDTNARSQAVPTKFKDRIHKIILSIIRTLSTFEILCYEMVSFSTFQNELEDNADAVVDTTHTAVYGLSQLVKCLIEITENFASFENLDQQLKLQNILFLLYNIVSHDRSCDCISVLIFKIHHQRSTTQTNHELNLICWLIPQIIKLLSILLNDEKGFKGGHSKSFDMMQLLLGILKRLSFIESNRKFILKVGNGKIIYFLQEVLKYRILEVDTLSVIANLSSNLFDDSYLSQTHELMVFLKATFQKSSQNIPIISSIFEVWSKCPSYLLCKVLAPLDEWIQFTLEVLLKLCAAQYPPEMLSPSVYLFSILRSLLLEGQVESTATALFKGHQSFTIILQSSLSNHNQDEKTRSICEEIVEILLPRVEFQRSRCDEMQWWHVLFDCVVLELESVLPHSHGNDCVLRLLELMKRLDWIDNDSKRKNNSLKVVSACLHHHMKCSDLDVSVRNIILEILDRLSEKKQYYHALIESGLLSKLVLLSRSDERAARILDRLMHSEEASRSRGSCSGQLGGNSYPLYPHDLANSDKNLWRLHSCFSMVIEQTGRDANINSQIFAHGSDANTRAGMDLVSEEISVDLLTNLTEEDILLLLLKRELRQEDEARLQMVLMKIEGLVSFGIDNNIKDENIRLSDMIVSFERLKTLLDDVVRVLKESIKSDKEEVIQRATNILLGMRKVESRLKKTIARKAGKEVALAMTRRLLSCQDQKETDGILLMLNDWIKIDCCRESMLAEGITTKLVDAAYYSKAVWSFLKGLLEAEVEIVTTTLFSNYKYFKAILQSSLSYHNLDEQSRYLCENILEVMLSQVEFKPSWYIHEATISWEIIVLELEHAVCIDEDNCACVLRLLDWLRRLNVENIKYGNNSVSKHLSLNGLCVCLHHHIENASVRNIILEILDRLSEKKQYYHALIESGLLSKLVLLSRSDERAARILDRLMHSEEASRSRGSSNGQLGGNSYPLQEHDHTTFCVHVEKSPKRRGSGTNEKDIVIAVSAEERSIELLAGISEEEMLLSLLNRALQQSDQWRFQQVLNKIEMAMKYGHDLIIFDDETIRKELNNFEQYLLKAIESVVNIQSLEYKDLWWVLSVVFLLSEKHMRFLIDHGIPFIICGLLSSCLCFESFNQELLTRILYDWVFIDEIRIFMNTSHFLIALESILTHSTDEAVISNSCGILQSLTSMETFCWILPLTSISLLVEKLFLSLSSESVLSFQIALTLLESLDNILQHSVSHQIVLSHDLPSLQIMVACATASIVCEDQDNVEITKQFQQVALSILRKINMYDNCFLIGDDYAILQIELLCGTY